MTYLSVLPGEVDIAISADARIVERLDQLSNRAWPTRENDKSNTARISALSAEEWCLMKLLEEAHMRISLGKPSLDVFAMRESLFEDLSDDGETDKWSVASYSAARIAQDLFAPHPDSQ